MEHMLACICIYSIWFDANIFIQCPNPIGEHLIGLRFFTKLLLHRHCRPKTWPAQDKRRWSHRRWNTNGTKFRAQARFVLKVVQIQALGKHLACHLLEQDEERASTCFSQMLCKKSSTVLQKFNSLAVLQLVFCLCTFIQVERLKSGVCFLAVVRHFVECPMVQWPVWSRYFASLAMKLNQQRTKVLKQQITQNQTCI